MLHNFKCEHERVRIDVAVSGHVPDRRRGSEFLAEVCRIPHDQVIRGKVTYNHTERNSVRGKTQELAPGG